MVLLTAQIRFDDVEHLDAPLLFKGGAQFHAHGLQQLGSPSAEVDLFGVLLWIAVELLKTFLGNRVEFDVGESSTAFECPVVALIVADDSAQSTKKERTEAAFVAADGVQHIVPDDGGEERLRQILGVRRRFPRAPQERVDGKPVGLADGLEGRSGGGIVTFLDLLDEGPVGGGEVGARSAHRKAVALWRIGRRWQWGRRDGGRGDNQTVRQQTGRRKTEDKVMGCVAGLCKAGWQAG